MSDNPYVVSDKLVDVDIYIDITDPSAPRVLSDEEEKKLEPDKLPEHIKKETSHWRRPNWTLSTLISSNAYTEDEQGRQRFNLTRFAVSRMRCLLLDWSLKTSGLVLERVVPPELPEYKMLSDKTIRMLGTIHSNIIDSFYAKAMAILYPEVSPALGEESGEELREKSES